MAVNDKFRADLTMVLKEAGERAEQVVRITALSLAKSLIEMSPVDSGRFKGNWQIGIGQIDTDIESAEDKGGGAVTARIEVGVGEWKSGETIYLTNSLPYARRLEYGWSKQAPGGMVRITVAEFGEYLNKAKKDAP